jgi:hypothetical protein
MTVTLNDPSTNLGVVSLSNQVEGLNRLKIQVSWLRSDLS